MDSNYSLADLMAVSGSKENGFSFGGVGGLILILLFFIIFGGAWGNGFGRNFNPTNESLSDLERDVLNGNCTTQKAVLESNYNTLMGFKDAQYQMSQCCCDLRTEITNQGAMTRQLIQDNTIQELRDRLDTANNALTVQTIVNQVVDKVKPCPIPAYPVCGGSLYGSYYPYGFNNGFNGGCGCNCGNI